ncbi:MAG: CPBP family intramembrane metalloprotease, partial [Gemmatimonadetes bacterium]|nr:CPBP family intramembrane metalloprotease [Gemmatimonadota bacterium]
MDPELGYPLALATGVGLFQHVAIAEEIAFRGALQSGIARQSGETQGLIWSSVIFGLAHAPNALVLPAEDRARYLLVGIPFLTAAGGFLGWVYQRADVWLGTAVFLAAGVAVSVLVDEGGVSTDRLGDDPNIFGETM